MACKISFGISFGRVKQKNLSLKKKKKLAIDTVHKLGCIC